MPRSVVPQVVVFSILTFLGFASLHLFPALKRGLFPVLKNSIVDGKSPDGIPLRKTFTGHHGVDLVLSALTSFFTSLLDGTDEAEATRWFTVWFLPQCSSVIAFWYFEAGRATYSPLRFPLLFGAISQLMGIGIGVPLFYLICTLTVPIPPTYQPRSAVVRAKTLLPAIFLGLIAPSAVMLFAPLSLHTKQLVAAVWQLFPLFISIVQIVHRAIHPGTWSSSTKSSTKEAEEAFDTVKGAYQICAYMSAVAHYYVLVPSLISPHPHLSFKNIFLPFYAHSYVPGATTAPATEVTYRHIARLFLHHDFLSLAVSSFVFFGWAHYISQTASPATARPKLSFVQWLVRMALITVGVGPGAAIAWAAVQREEQVLVAIQVADVVKEE